MALTLVDCPVGTTFKPLVLSGTKNGRVRGSTVHNEVQGSSALYKRNVSAKYRVNKRRKNRRLFSFIPALLKQMENGEIDIGSDYDPDIDEYLESGFNDLDTEECMTRLLDSIERTAYQNTINSISQFGLTTDEDLPSHWRLIPTENPDLFDETLGISAADRQSKIKKLLEFGQTTLGYTPADWQLYSSLVVLEGMDLLLSARTGAGKSTVYQLLLTDMRVHRSRAASAANTTAPNSTLLVISPLISLIKEQARFFNKQNISACALIGETLVEDPGLWRRIDKGEFRVVFASPEILLSKGSYFWVRMAPLKRKHPFLKRLVAIVIDEAHCAYKYGDSGFRPEYAKLGDFRYVFPDLPFCCLSATIPPNVREYLHVSLKLSNPTFFVQRSIHR